MSLLLCHQLSRLERAPETNNLITLFNVATVRGASKMLEWIVQPASSWSFLQAVAFVIGTLISSEALGGSAQLLCRNAPIAPRVSLFRARSRLDSVYTAVNKLFAVVFNYGLIRFIVSWPTIVTDLGGANLSNTMAAFIFIALADDLLYYAWHRALHWDPMFAAIHCIHHRERSPSLGIDDAFAAHPVEYAVSALCIPASIMMCPFECHVAAIAAFLAAITVMSTLNHTRLVVRVGSLFDTRIHSVHHARGARGGNYAQFAWVWDWAMGTYVGTCSAAALTQ